MTEAGEKLRRANERHVQSVAAHRETAHALAAARDASVAAGGATPVPQPGVAPPSQPQDAPS